MQIGYPKLILLSVKRIYRGISNEKIFIRSVCFGTITFNTK